MKKFVLFALLLLLTGCSKTVQITCNEPEIEVFIDDENYGRPPILLKVPHNKLYVYASFRRNGIEIHKQRINFIDGQNYYEISIPRHLQKNGNHKYHSNH